LELVDGLLKNCPTTHKHIGSANFQEAILKVAHSKKKSRRILKDKCLDCVQFWGEAFKDQATLYNFWNTYQILQQKGAVFPPKRDEKFEPPKKKKKKVRRSVPPENGNSELSLDKQIDIVNTNRDLLKDMLLNLPEGQSVADNELIKDVAQKCEKMHERMVSIIQNGQVKDEVHLAQLLSSNDELAAVIQMYDDAVQGKPITRPKPEQEDTSNGEKVTKKKKKQIKVKASSEEEENTDELFIDTKNPKRKKSQVIVPEVPTETPSQEEELKKKPRKSKRKKKQATVDNLINLDDLESNSPIQENVVNTTASHSNTNTTNPFLETPGQRQSGPTNPFDLYASRKANIVEPPRSNDTQEMFDPFAEIGNHPVTSTNETANPFASQSTNNSTTIDLLL